MRKSVIACLLVMALLGIANATERQIPPRASARLQREIRRELITLPYYGVFDHLAFRLNGYHVTLIGYVTQPTLSTAAERVVRGIEGVEGVTNRIQTLPLSSFDDRIRWRVYRAVYGHIALNRYALNPNPPIRIIPSVPTLMRQFSWS